MSGSYATVSHSNRGLVMGLKQHGVLTSKRVEAVMCEVDRGAYTRSLDEAYEDHPLSIGKGQTISAPHMHVVALQVLEPLLTPDARVLDVGSGSGYLTALFAKMIGTSGAGKVYGIERIEHLVEFGRENMRRANPELASKVEIVQGDGWKGLPERGPFDAIHVGAAAEELPKALIDQLAPGGRMVIPVGGHSRFSGGQELLQVEKDSVGKVSSKKLFSVIYVPLVRENEAQ